MGSRMVASAAVSAIAEPLIDASNTAAPIATKPRPPRIWPTKARARSMMRRDRPPAFISSPARMKNGTASSGKLSNPACRFCASSCESKKSRCHISATPVRISECAIGMPMTMPPISTARKIRVTIMLSVPCCARYSTSLLSTTGGSPRRRSTTTLMSRPTANTRVAAAPSASG